MRMGVAGSVSNVRREPDSLMSCAVSPASATTTSPDGLEATSVTLSIPRQAVAPSVRLTRVSSPEGDRPTATSEPGNTIVCRKSLAARPAQSGCSDDSQYHSHSGVGGDIARARSLHIGLFGVSQAGEGGEDKNPFHWGPPTVGDPGTITVGVGRAAAPFPPPSRVAATAPAARGAARDGEDDEQFRRDPPAAPAAAAVRAFVWLIVVLEVWPCERR